MELPRRNLSPRKSLRLTLGGGNGERLVPQWRAPKLSFPVMDGWESCLPHDVRVIAAEGIFVLRVRNEEVALKLLLVSGFLERLPSGGVLTLGCLFEVLVDLLLIEVVQLDGGVLSQRRVSPSDRALGNVPGLAFGRWWLTFR